MIRNDRATLRRVPAPLLAAATATAILVGCAPSPGPDVRPPTGSPTPTAAAYRIVPEPGRTIAATPPTTGALDGYRIAVVVPQNASPDAVSLLAAARGLARQSGADLAEFPAPTPDDDGVAAALDEAIEDEPDLVLGLGEGIVDLFSFETAQRLDSQFLIVGAQLAEPTENVTAVIWDGATSRGSAASPDGELEAAPISPERGAGALAAGIASVRDGVTGVVLHLGS